MPPRRRKGYDQVEGFLFVLELVWLQLRHSVSLPVGPVHGNDTPD